MSITVWDIKEAAFTSDVKDVEEIILTNKGATDVGALAQALQLRSLSLAFNSLSNLSSLAPLVRLQSLNVSHNQLASLKGLQSLTCLVTLNASHNKVVSLGPLSGLSCLADLWLQHNAVAAPGELRVLAGLPGLQRLAIANNPLAKALPPDSVRLLALRLCPGLRLVDGRPVEAQERTAADELDMDALLCTRPAAPGSAPAATPTLGALGSLGTWPTDSGAYGSRRPSYTGAAGKGASGGLTGIGRGRPVHPMGRLSAGSASAATTPESRLPVSSARRPKRVSSFDMDAAAPDSLSYSGGPTAAGGSGPLESTPSFCSSSAASSPSPSPHSVRLMRSGSGSAGSGGSSRRPPLPGATPRPAAQLQGTQFQAVLDALPRFDTAKLPSRATPVRARAPPPPPPPKPPPDAHLVEQEIRYTPQRGGGRAIVVRRDGSAAAFWPGGDMAVTVDADYGAVVAASTTGLRSEDARAGNDVGVEPAAPAGGGLPYRMMVMYRAGGVAASWDASGGFVQYPSGGLMLMYSRTTGTGTCYSPSGDITRRWRDPDAPPSASPPAISIVLPFALANSSPPTPPAPPPPPPTHIDMQLDPHLGVRLLAASRTLELYLCCEGVRYRLRCGRNTPGEEWEPPAGRGDGAARGTNSRLATPSSYDSQPATPTGGSGTARFQPYIGEGPSGVWGGVGASTSGGGAGGGGTGDAEELPPPAFLRNLARQGGAGTHRHMGGGGAASRQGSGLGASGLLSGDSAGGGGLEGISSITAGLQALELGLQAWLARDTTQSKSTKTDEAATAASSSASGTSEATIRLAAPPSAAAARSRRIGGGSGVSAARALAAADAQDIAAAAAAGSNDTAAASAAATSTAGSSGSGGADGEWPSLLAASGGGGNFESVAMGEAVTAADGVGEGQAGGSSSRNEDEGGGGARGLDSAVVAQLAAARKLAAESLAAAMAAAGAVAALGSS